MLNAECRDRIIQTFLIFNIDNFTREPGILFLCGLNKIEICGTFPIISQIRKNKLFITYIIFALTHLNKNGATS